MIVVSDTSPLNYLVLVNAVHVLPALFEQVYVPDCVVTELNHAAAPEAVRAWIASPPEWLHIRAPAHVQPDPKLQPGELHAISLAEELRADHILVDEWEARQAATSRGLHVVGTLGVIRQAAHRGLIDLKEALARLLETTFRVDRNLIDQVLREAT